MVVDELDVNEGEIQALTEQSSFEASQSVLLGLAPKPGEQPHSKKRMFLLIGLGVFILLTTLNVLGAPRKGIQIVVSTPPPSATPLIQTSQMKLMLIQLETNVREANPDDVLNSPPQVDMSIEF